MPTPTPTPNIAEAILNDPLGWSNANQGSLTLFIFLLTLGSSVSAVLFKNVILPAVRQLWRVKHNYRVTALKSYTNPDALLRDLCPQSSDGDPLPPHTVPFQPREIGKDLIKDLSELLDAHNFLLIKGHSGVGKTRAAAELALLKMQNDFVVLRLTPGWLDRPSGPIPELSGRRRALLILDDINSLPRESQMHPNDADTKPAFGFGSFHDRLSRLLDELQNRLGDGLYVIATARDDSDEWPKIKPEHEVWRGFHIFTLEHFSEEAYAAALAVVGKSKGVDIVNGALIAKTSNLRPQTLVMNIRAFAIRGEPLTPESATPNETRSHRAEYDRRLAKNPFVSHVYTAIKVLKENEVPTALWLVKPLAARIAGWNLLQRWLNDRQLSMACASLPTSGEVVVPRDGEIEAAPISVVQTDHFAFITRVALQRARMHSPIWNEIATAIAEHCFHTGDYSSAEKLLDAFIQTNPDSSAAHFNLGIVRSVKGDIEGAERAYRAAIRSDSHNAMAHFNLGALLAQKGNSKGAEDANVDAIRSDPNLAGAHTNLGVLLDRRGDTEGAKRAHLAAIQADPRHVIALTNLGEVLTKLHEYDEAKLAYRKAIQADPSHAEAHVNFGLLLGKLGDTTGEEKVYRSAIHVVPKPQLASIYYSLGVFLGNQGDIDAEVSAYKSAIQANPKHVRAQINLGIALTKKGDFTRAEEALQSAIKSDPQYGAAYTNLGMLFATKGDYATAKRAFRAAIRVDAKDATAYSNLGVVLDQQRDFYGAERAFQIARVIDPKNAANLQNYVSFLRRQGRIHDAISASMQWKSAAPDEYRPWLELAGLHRQLANLVESSRCASEARKLIPMTATYDRACFESIGGNVDTAFKLLERLKADGKLDSAWARVDTDLQWIRNDPRFANLLGPS